MITPAYAQTAGADASGGMLAMLLQIAPLLFIFGIFYVLMIRPQQKRIKEQQAALNAIRRGDEVVTGGGVIGKVTKVDEAQLEVEIAPNVRVRVVKATVSQVLTASAKAAND